jgi:hypothetical protein
MKNGSKKDGEADLRHSKKEGNDGKTKTNKNKAAP